MLDCKVENRIIYATLNHVDRGNSFGADEGDQLEKALKLKNINGLILTGEGRRFFCTGGNLHQQTKAKSARIALNQQIKIRKALESLSRTSFPTVALINGDCFGGGIELLSACDHIISAPHVFFGFWQRRLGLSFGWGGGERLAKRLSPQVLREYVQSTEIFTSSRALQIGLVDEKVESPRLNQRAMEWLASTNAFPSYKELKSWEPKKSDAIFNSLWMNPQHKKVLKKHRA